MRRRHTALMLDLSFADAVAATRDDFRRYPSARRLAQSMPNLVAVTLGGEVKGERARGLYIRAGYKGGQGGGVTGG